MKVIKLCRRYPHTNCLMLRCEWHNPDMAICAKRARTWLLCYKFSHIFPSFMYVYSYRTSIFAMLCDIDFRFVCLFSYHLIQRIVTCTIFAKNPLENESPLFQPRLLVSRLIGLFLPTSISTDAKWCVRYVVLLEPHGKLLWHLDSFGFFALALMFRLKRTKAGTNCCAVFAFPRKNHALQTDKAAVHFHNCDSPPPPFSYL